MVSAGAARPRNDGCVGVLFRNPPAKSPLTRGDHALPFACIARRAGRPGPAPLPLDAGRRDARGRGRHRRDHQGRRGRLGPPGVRRRARSAGHHRPHAPRRSPRLARQPPDGRAAGRRRRPGAVLSGVARHRGAARRDSLLPAERGAASRGRVPALSRRRRVARLLAIQPPPLPRLPPRRRVLRRAVRRHRHRPRRARPAVRRGHRGRDLRPDLAGRRPGGEYLDLSRHRTGGSPGAGARTPSIPARSRCSPSTS